MAKLTSTQRHNIVVEYLYGASATTLAARYSIAENYVYTLVKRYRQEGNQGITPRTLIGLTKPTNNTTTKQKLRTAKAKGLEISELVKLESEHIKVVRNQGEIVRNIKHAQRGFVIPKHMEKEYVELLKTGKYSCKEAAAEIERRVHQQSALKISKTNPKKTS